MTLGPAALILSVTALLVVHHYALATRTGLSPKIKKLGGGLLLGSSALLFTPTLDLPPSALAVGLWVALPYAVAVPALWLSARKNSPDGATPLQWAVYLLGYECLFRGALLSGLVEPMGVWPALAVVTGLYTLAHLHKPAAETMSCIPMGLVFGWCALETGGFVGPAVLHLLIAFTHDRFAASRQSR